MPWPDQSPAVDRLAEMLTAYHLQTELEKGEDVHNVNGLAHCYQAEVLDPLTAFVDAVVLMALDGDTAVGCLVLTAPLDGHSEIKRLWTDPAFRSQGIAGDLVSAALAKAAEQGVNSVRLSVWAWRAHAIALYERLGFNVVESWDERSQLVCMEAWREGCP